MQKSNKRRIWNGLCSVGQVLSHVALWVGCGLVLVDQAAAAQGTFSPTGPFGAGRSGQFTLTELCDGTALVTGGQGPGGQVIASAERYDKGTWTATGPMHFARGAHTATLLKDSCQVLVAGGTADAGATAEIFDPQTGVFTMVGNLTVGRNSHTASLLPTGRVLIAGGVAQVAGNAHGITAAELYDPASRTFLPTAPLHVGRLYHLAVTLFDGRVLVAGGTADGGSAGAAATSTEIYDPTLSNWSVAGSMPTGRWQDYTLTLLSNHDVMAAGGVTAWTLETTARTEIFSVVTGQWTSTAPMPTTRFGHSATLLANDQILVAGGNDHPGAFGTGTTLNTAILYDPSTSTWTPVDSRMGNLRQKHMAMRLKNGAVLIAGGHNGVNAVAAAELYNDGPTFPPLCGASDPDDDPITFTATGLPPGLTMDPKTCAISGTLSYTKNTSDRDYLVEVTASDGTTTITRKFNWKVTPVNMPPILTNPGHQISPENAIISLALSASDPNGDPLTFTASGLPPGLTIDPTTGVISGTIPYKSAKTYTVTVKVLDNRGGEDSKDFQWDVTHTNQPPIMPIPADRTNKEGDVVVK